MNRTAYMAALHEALDRLLANRGSIDFRELQLSLRDSLEFDPPAGTTLARVLVGRGWVKRPLGGPTVYDFVAKP